MYTAVCAKLIRVPFHKKKEKIKIINGFKTMISMSFFSQSFI